MAEDGNPEGVVPADGDHAPVTDSAGAGMHPHDPEHMPDDDLNADYMLGGEEDEDEDMDAHAMKEFGESNLLAGAQRALFEQLERARERVMVEKREADYELRLVREKKEQVGVELYGNQQQLAKLQTTLEQLQTSYADIVETRGQEEKVLGEFKTRHVTLKSTNVEKQKSVLKAQAELDALNETIMQIEKYNEEMKSEIAITRRATYKAENTVQELEKAKEGQDLYIDNLNRQLKSLNEQIDVYDAQFEVQQVQTEEAKKILAETTGEMELITFEKKQLMQQWKTSLINLTKRDEAVAAANKQLEHAKTELQDMAAEIIGLKREIIAAQASNESMVAIRDRLVKEEQQLEEQTSRILMERDQLAERYQMLQRSMAQTEDETKKVTNEGEEIQKKIDTIVQNIQVVNRERQKIELSILHKENEQVTVAKAAKNFAKAMQQVRGKRHDKEMEASNIENELSRIRVDSLNTEAHNVQLKEILDKQLADLQGKDKLIEKYQMEIRQRNDEIEKKMYRVDRLNRKYEKLVEAQGDDEGPLLGPLEATIKNIKKEIQTLGEESGALQKNWLNDQTALVEVSVQTEDIMDTNSELRARIAILSEKKLRTGKEIVVNEGEVKALEQSIKGLHTDMARLNELIGKNAELQAELANTNSVMELDFVAELKELEHQSVQMESRVQGLKSAKAGLLDEIMEAERQLLLWEKKIQLEKETQQALDPEVGMSEIHSMEKEIHRMELRRTALKGEKDKLVQEIERGVHKREAMALRQLGKDKVMRRQGASAKEKPSTKAGLSKQTSGLKRSIKQTARSTAQHVAAIRETKVQMQRMTEMLEKYTAEYSRYADDANRLEVDINQQLYEKQRKAEILGKRERMLTRYQDLNNGARLAVEDGDRPLVMERLREADGELNGVMSIIESLRSQFGYLDETLTRVMLLSQDQ